eukprot:GILK01002340.1.p1 GENE.GILK01002340.1~~GILK01002340.1.p1  ORF type:complete len:146 (-),score=23.86 GILK01002340.1:65-502(-)
MSKLLASIANNPSFQKFWTKIQLYRMMNEVRPGTLVGVDAAGNKYFEDPEQLGRSRWVEYAKKRDWNASQVSSDWHAWMHYMTDTPPPKADTPQHSFMKPHEENHTGTANIFKNSGHYLHPNCWENRQYNDERVVQAWHKTANRK